MSCIVCELSLQVNSNVGVDLCLWHYFQRFPSLQFVDMKWKLGVAMSSDTCRSLKYPYVTVTLTVADPSGQITDKSFEMTIPQFQVCPECYLNVQSPKNSSAIVGRVSCIPWCICLCCLFTRTVMQTGTLNNYLKHRILTS